MPTFHRWIPARALGLFVGLGLALVASGPKADPIALGLWEEFSFTEIGVDARGCDPDDPLGDFCIPSGGTPTSFLPAPPWTFATSGPATLVVTDAFESGERFAVFDFGVSVGMTSAPVAGAVVDCGDDPLSCVATSGMSTGTFVLAGGAHSLTITLVESLGPGAGYLLVNAQAVPEPGTLALFAVGLVGLALLRFRR